MEQMHSVVGGGGLRLNVGEWGNPEGPCILFVHGWSQTYMTWLKQLDGALAEKYRLVAFDLRGHGMSEAPREQAAYTDSRLWAEDVNAVIESLSLTQPLLVGWSYAGLVITDYLRRYGDESVAGVNFVGAAVVLNEQALGPLIGPGFFEIFARATGGDLEESIDAMREFVYRCFAAKLSRKDYERTLCWNMTVRPDVRASLAARDLDASDVLRALKKPVLVTQGMQDETVLPAMAELIQSCCPHATVSWYEESAHGPFIEEAERFNQELDEFAAFAAARGAA